MMMKKEIRMILYHVVGTYLLWWYFTRELSVFGQESKLKMIKKKKSLHLFLFNFKYKMNPFLRMSTKAHINLTRRYILEQSSRVI